MKKTISVLMLILVILFSCKKEVEEKHNNNEVTPVTNDTIKPIVILIGNVTDIVTFNSASNYNDPGCTANDNVDGNLTSSIIVTGTVNIQSAGEYTLVYSASDKAGNVGTVSRTVVVDAAPYIAGTWSRVDSIDGNVYPAENEVLTVTSTAHNKIITAKFAGYTNATPYMIFSGTSISMPVQTIICGMDNQPRTFASTSGSFTITNPITMIIRYSITQGMATVDAKSTYTKQ